ncbi:transposase family protein [Phormidium tenue FACHB-886]|nr:transposase family protein [Phormidium tenue FACHB-886]
MAKPEPEVPFVISHALENYSIQAVISRINVGIHTAYPQTPHPQKPNHRRYGGGRKPHLEQPCDKLLFILFYLRHYPTQEVQGFLLGIAQPQADPWVHRLTQVLNQALGYEQQLPERNPHRLEAVLKDCPSLEFIIDGTERPINRPADPEAQRETYSGKKKTHTLNNNIISHQAGKEVYLSDTYEGSVHDKLICDLEGHAFPEESKLWQDKGYQGYQPEGVTILQPKKTPPLQELSEAEKDRNREIARERIEIEHQINGIKQYRIVTHRLRSRTDHYANDVMETACELHNFRLTHRQLAAS